MMEFVHQIAMEQTRTNVQNPLQHAATITAAILELKNKLTVASFKKQWRHFARKAVALVIQVVKSGFVVSSQPSLAA